MSEKLPVKYKAWLGKNTTTLWGKKVAVTGATGGLGRELTRYLAFLGADLIFIDRNRQRSEALKAKLVTEFPEAKITCLTADLEDMTSVRAVTEQLIKLEIDVLIHNAGAYSIPRKICDTGYGNVFQINFLSPYYMIRRLLPSLAERHGRVIAVGSIAHNYSQTNEKSIDFAEQPKASKVYGNAKRYLMFSLYELFENEKDVTLSITHPGITFTGITAHYPKLIFALIKHPMKVIFMRPRKAALSILRGVFEPCTICEWIGPRIFDVWGKPRKKLLKTCSVQERAFIAQTAEKLYQSLT